MSEPSKVHSGNIFNPERTADHSYHLDIGGPLSRGWRGGGGISEFYMHRIYVFIFYSLFSPHFGLQSGWVKTLKRVRTMEFTYDTLRENISWFII